MQLFLSYVIIAVIIVLAIVYWFYYTAKPVSRVVSEYEKGLLFEQGRFKQVVDPGIYRLLVGKWHRQELIVLDTRETSLLINGQEILTKDGVTVKVTVLVRYHIIDPKKAYLTVDSFRDRLYQGVQLILRDVIGGVDFEQLLVDRGVLGKDMTNHTDLASYGLYIDAIDIKDMAFSQELRDAFAKSIRAKKEAEAALVSAREKVATARALANAAQIVKENPTILQLKKLDILQQAAERQKNTFIIHLDEATEKDSGR